MIWQTMSMITDLAIPNMKYIITLNLKMTGENEADALENLKKIIESGSTTSKEGKYLAVRLKDLDTAKIIEYHE